MKTLKLNPNQIISSNHDVLHDMHVFRIYYKICRDGGCDLLPPAPVIHKDLVVKYFKDDLLAKFNAFFATDRAAEYFLLDGSHKTTAANLRNEKISVMVLENDVDIEECKEMLLSGDIFQWLLGDDIRYIISDLILHFKKLPSFRTVEKKTLDLVELGVIPSFMIGREK